MRKGITLTIIMLSFLCFTLVGMPHVTAASSEKADISMNVSPHDALFDIENMKPGDWAPRTITIENDGKRDFNYVVEIDHNGADTLYQELILELKTDDKEIYSGKVIHFKDLSARELKVGQTEKLEFTIHFPEHLGNAYQGLDTNFSILLTAVDSENNALLPTASGQKDSGGTHYQDNAQATFDGTIGSDGEAPLPETATNIFNFLIMGGILAMTGIILAAYNRKRKKA